MAVMPTRVTQRISSNLNKYQRVLKKAVDQDINESDTSMIITDILSDVFGFDKYSEITSEQAIRGTYCDLAIKIGGQIKLLIECKAIGLDLKDAYVKQAVDYAANQGIEWVALTNGIFWWLFRVIFAQPIDKELVCNFNFLDLNPRNSSDMELLYLLTKEGLDKSALSDYYSKQQAVSKFIIAALIYSPPMIGVIRREIRKMSNINVDASEIERILLNEVLKREVVQDEKAREAAKKVKRILGRKKKQKVKKQSESTEEPQHPPEPSEPETA